MTVFDHAIDKVGGKPSQHTAHLNNLDGLQAFDTWPNILNSLNFQVDSSGSTSPHPLTLGPTVALLNAALPRTVVVGVPTGLQFTLSFDNSVLSSPIGAMLEQAAKTAAGVYAMFFSNKENIKIQVGYGEIGGYTMTPNYRCGVSHSLSYDYLNYATTVAALKHDSGYSIYNQTANYFLPAKDPTATKVEAGTFRLTSAEERALGLSGKTPAYDGQVGIATIANAGAWALPVAGSNNLADPRSNDLTGVMLHEISEIMGRVGFDGLFRDSNDPHYNPLYSPLDLFRFQDLSGSLGTGLLDIPFGDKKEGWAGLSFDGGDNIVNTYNDPQSWGASGEDLADWNATRNDAYGSNVSGQAEHITAGDVIEDALLGYKLTAAGKAFILTPHAYP